MIVTAVIVVFVVLNSLNYISGVLATPAGSIFLGTVHWPGDYLYYLSQFVQGKESWFLGFDLYTSDFPTKTLVGWVNIFLGRVFYLLGINHFLAYQLSIVIFSTTFLLLSYLLIRQIFPDKAEDRGARIKRLAAFVLFVFSNAFPKIVYEGGRLSLSYFDFWFNIGLPFNRLVGVPHQLIARTSISLVLLLGLWWWKRDKEDKRDKKRKWGSLLGLTFLGFLLASIDPVHWGLVVVVLFTVPFIDAIVKLIIDRHRFQLKDFIKSEIRISKSETNSNDRNSKFETYNKFWSFEHLNFDIVSNLGFRASYFLPSLFFFLGGLPMALYLKNLFAKPPYLQLAVWEVTQQVRINIGQFILGNGPVVVLAILGLPFFSRRLTLAKIMALGFTFLTLGLYFSPIPQKLALINVRFLPATIILFLACFASEAIYQFTQRFRGKQSVVTLIVMGCIFLILAPTYFVQIQNKIKVDTTNGFFYITQTTYAAYDFAQKNSTPESVFLVIWPFNWSFPAVTGRHVFEGHSLLTIDYEKKDKQASDFFFGQISKKKMQELLDREKIDYIVTYPWSRNINELEKVKKIYDNGYMAVFNVDRK